MSCSQFKEIGDVSVNGAEIKTVVFSLFHVGRYLDRSTVPEKNVNWPGKENGIEKTCLRSRLQESPERGAEEMERKKSTLLERISYPPPGIHPKESSAARPQEPKTMAGSSSEQDCKDRRVNFNKARINRKIQNNSNTC